MADYGKSTFDLDANLVALLCYLGNLVCYAGLILSIITVIQDKDNKLARFHAWQSIFLSIFGILLVPLYMILGTLGFAIDTAMGVPIFTLLFMLVCGFLGILFLVTTIIAAIKGFGGEEYKIPIVGNVAAKYV